MQVKLEEKKGLARELKVTVPAKDVDAAFENRFNALQKQVKIDGFRPGKAPMDVIKKRYGDQVKAEVGEQLMQTSIGKALQEAKAEPAGQPRLGSSEAPVAGKDYNYSIEFDIYPEVKPKGVEKIKLTRTTAAADDKLVDQSIDELFKSARAYAPKKGAAAEGDQLTIDAIGYLDGEEEPFEGGRLADFNLVIGSKQLIDGFEEGLVGAKAGDEKSLNLKFPKEYPADHVAGKKCRFEVSVKAVSEPASSKPDDEFAKQFGAKDLADLKAKVKERLEADLANASEQKLKRELFDALDKANSFDVPQGLASTEFQAIWRQQMQDMQARGLQPETMGKNLDEMRSEFQELAERRVRLGLLLTEIGKQQDVQVTEEEISAEVNKVASQYGDQADQVKAYYQKPENRQQLLGPIYEQKVVTWLLEKAEVKETKGDAAELLKELG